MKRIRKISLLFALPLLLALQGCNKIWDIIKNSPDGVYSKCRIREITDIGEPKKLSFFYNKYGNPDSIVSSNVSTGYQSLLFRYDNKQRMIESQYYPENPRSFIYWSKYYYDNKGRIAKDTSHLWGSIVNGQPTWHWGDYFHSYEYDNKDRIIKITRYWRAAGSTEPPAFSDVQNFAYNEDGNLTRSGVVYDNKLSMFRTHKIWMFMARDYSINNPFTATGYNDKGLPTRIKAQGDVYNVPSSFLNFHGNKITDATVVWDCK
ncbi:hypothetical protein HHL16_22405 [Pseudoflavitalea sp. G-6-1-2]|uniref:hypothetical protein n=1 Tax=Pseudoflavitalea sp. G-6-1-2 TaxID=2728841 RepID=UPI00146E898A|nr:hypothetical protein [Pseudoflavitalea sp. G-6-1-2]NML23649.1 hypothetical protein [Pseudoflavitalea sp. G-6-1-2]